MGFLLAQTQGAGLSYHKLNLPRLALSSDFEQFYRIEGVGCMGLFYIWCLHRNRASKRLLGSCSNI